MRQSAAFNNIVRSVMPGKLQSTTSGIHIFAIPVPEEVVYGDGEHVWDEFQYALAIPSYISPSYNSGYRSGNVAWGGPWQFESPYLFGYDDMRDYPPFSLTETLPTGYGAPSQGPQPWAGNWSGVDTTPE